MKWKDLSDKDKVKLILQYVIPHDMGNDLIFKNGDIITPKGKRQINYPIAAWDEMLERWQTRDIGSNGSEIFDPLHDMNDAWKIIVESPIFIKMQLERGVSGEYTCILWIAKTPIGVKAHAKTPQDAICLAVLRAYGVEIEP